MEETAEWHDGRWPSPEEAPMGGRLSLESRFPSFEEAIDVADEMRQRRHARGKTLAMRAIAALLIVAAICIGGFPAMLQYRSARDLSGTSVRSAQTVAGWPIRRRMMRSPRPRTITSGLRNPDSRFWVRRRIRSLMCAEDRVPVCPILVNRTMKRVKVDHSCPILVNRTIRVVRVQARTPVPRTLVPQAPVRRTRSTGVCWIPAVA